MADAMSPREFKYGLLRLANDSPELINERVVARYLAAAYIDADKETKRDSSIMLRQDLEALSTGDRNPNQPPT